MFLLLTSLALAGAPATATAAAPTTSAPATVATPANLHQQVIELLSGMEKPATADQWKALGPQAEAELVAIAADPAGIPTQRGNALVALGFFPSDAAHTFLSTTLADHTTPVLLRRKACAGLGLGWGAAAVPELAVALADTDSNVRLSAARALVKVKDASATTAIQARAAVETDTNVLAVLKKGVKP